MKTALIEASPAAPFTQMEVTPDEWPEADPEYTAAVRGVLVEAGIRGLNLIALVDRVGALRQQTGLPFAAQHATTALAWLRLCGEVDLSERYRVQQGPHCPFVLPSPMYVMASLFNGQSADQRVVN